MTSCWSAKDSRLIARLADDSSRVIQADLGDLAVRGELGLMGLAVDPELLPTADSILAKETD